MLPMAASNPMPIVDADHARHWSRGLWTKASGLEWQGPAEGVAQAVGGLLQRRPWKRRAVQHASITAR